MRESTTATAPNEGEVFYGWIDAATDGTKLFDLATAEKGDYELTAKFGALLATKESWVVQKETSLTSGTTIASTETMVDGDLFSMQAKDFDVTVNSHSKTTVKPTLQGDNSTTTLQTGLTADLAAKASKEVTIKSKAPKAITMKLYVVFGQNAFNGDRSGTVQVKVGDEVRASVEAKRANYVLTFTLQEDEEATLIFTNGESLKAGQIWIFGAEAEIV